VPGLGASFGRGAATSYQQDLANSDAILIMGSNMAEAHPVGFRWPMKAKAKGGKLIHVDPRYTRTSAVCDVHVQIRAGSDIAFLGGLIHYVLTHDRWFPEYVLAYTNASTLIDERFQDTEDLDGLFSGYDAEMRDYDPSEGHWSYKQPEGQSEGEQGDKQGGSQAKHDKGTKGVHGHGIDGGASTHNSPQGQSTESQAGQTSRDHTLQDPNCVMQLLRKHFARYTPELCAEICGCTPEQLVHVAEMLCDNSGRERTSAICYAVGWTQHTTGVQIIRAASILQLLLGNMGRPGGGIMALRGHASIQGSTDIPTLYDLLPGYLPQPTADKTHDTLDSYVKYEGLPTGYWVHFKAFMVSLLKAYYGEVATPENDFCYNWLPRLDDDYSMIPVFQRMAKGDMTGYFIFGQNPAAGAVNAKIVRKGLRNLDWLVVADWFETESAVFWKNDPTGPPPSDIKTEVFFIPAASSPEKEGTLTNTQRLIQWHDKALDPPDDCRSDLWFMYNLGKRLRKLYEGSTDPKDQPLLHLTWDYEYDEPPRLPDGTISRIQGEPDGLKVLQEINGHHLTEIDPTTGKFKLLTTFDECKDDGTTACGCWIYSGVTPEYSRNRTRDRVRTPGNSVDPDWAFAWPKNRRILYNRASADPAGKPWSERKKYIFWDEEAKKWVGPDVPDFEPTKPPTYRAPKGAVGMEAIDGDAPFIMHPDGLSWLFAPGGTKDAPLPTHYEAAESPVRNLMYGATQDAPTTRYFDGPGNKLAHTVETDYPVVACTFRLTEHYLSGPMSRFNSWLNELMPTMFIEISPELAALHGIEHGGWMVAESPRGQVEARALVTKRIKPMTIDGKAVHQIGIPFQWGYAGETVGSMANDLTALLADPNVSMHEAKVFVCRVRAGRAANQPTEPTKPTVRWANREPVPDTPAGAQPEGHLEKHIRKDGPRTK
jgi:formate dehydrogenase major subunit